MNHHRQDSEKAMAPHSSTLAWKIPWAEESGRLQSMGSHRVRHDWSDLAAAAVAAADKIRGWYLNQLSKHLDLRSSDNQILWIWKKTLNHCRSWEIQQHWESLMNIYIYIHTHTHTYICIFKSNFIICMICMILEFFVLFSIF